MSWFKIDDQSAFHSKVLACGNEAWGAFCRMGAHCSAHTMDGHVSEQVALTIAPKKVVQRLVESGLLEIEEGGYAIHDYHEYNPTREQVTAKRTARAEAGRKGGLTSSQAKQQAKGQAFASAKGKQNSTPSPSHIAASSNSAGEAAGSGETPAAVDAPGMEGRDRPDAFDNTDPEMADLMAERAAVLAKFPHWGPALDVVTPPRCQNVVKWQSYRWREWAANPQLAPKAPPAPTPEQLRSAHIAAVTEANPRRPEERTSDYLDRLAKIFADLNRGQSGPSGGAMGTYSGAGGVSH